MYTINEMLNMNNSDIETVEQFFRVSDSISLRNINLRVGTVIRFSMNDGHIVEALAVSVENNKAIFIHMECLPDKLSMGDDCCESYAYSDVREYLNDHVYNKYPEYIKEHMVEFDYDYIEGDYLCLPCAEEILGNSTDGVDYGACRFKPMKNIRNVLGFYGWISMDYWVDDCDNGTFYYIDEDGYLVKSDPDVERGIRPMFQLSLV